jgi:DNA polymerase-3 subunit gamma/tau
MSYQVLARKWRPKNFESLVGQDHVVRALSHALESKRLHHAYLFTGTRGVGKTTLSRILAKALNCVGPDGQGDITARPCGICQPCLEIDAGHFVDYLEMDAASNRGVDEMAALLEQAIYAPANARFKVYMIDEVHMLSSYAFNAMLKTLEEPPDYVKFILATTDAQKIPVTVLSRCLQFNLKQMSPGQVAGHLETILKAEAIAYETPALAELGRAAHGSMRDALSLTDQAIAYNAGRVSEEAVRAMLGTLDSTYLHRLLDALLAQDGATLLAIADEMQERSLSYRVALQDLGGLLHRVAVQQHVPDAAHLDGDERAAIERFAAAFSPEDVQLNYEICNRGRDDLDLAPDEYSGFTMTLLRMLAFRPLANPDQARVAGTPGAARASAALHGPANGASASSAAIKPPPSRPPSAASSASSAARAPARSPRVQASATASAPEIRPAAARVPADEDAAELDHARRANQSESPTALASTVSDAPIFDSNWLALAAQLKVTGLTRQLVEQAELVSFSGSRVHLRVPIRHLLEAGVVEKLRGALAQHFGRAIEVTTELGAISGVTVAATENSERATRQAQAVDSIESDPFVQALIKDFGATVNPASIKPAG